MTEDEAFVTAKDALFAVVIFAHSASLVLSRFLVAEAFM